MISAFSKNRLKLRLYKTKCVTASLVDNVNLVGLCITEYEEIMSQKLHLNACILRIHGLNAKALGADDTDLVLIIICTVLYKIVTENAACLLMSGNELVAILLELTLDNLLNEVDGNIHVIADLL